MKEDISVVGSRPLVEVCYGNPGKFIHSPHHPTNFLRSQRKKEVSLRTYEKIQANTRLYWKNPSVTPIFWTLKDVGVVGSPLWKARQWKRCKPMALIEHCYSAKRNWRQGVQVKERRNWSESFLPVNCWVCQLEMFHFKTWKTLVLFYAIFHCCNSEQQRSYLSRNCQSIKKPWSP